MENVKKKTSPLRIIHHTKPCVKVSFLYIEQYTEGLRDITFLTKVFLQNFRKMAENQHKQQLNKKFVTVRITIPNRISQK